MATSVGAAGFLGDLVRTPFAVYGCVSARGYAGAEMAAVRLGSDA